MDRGKKRAIMPSAATLAKKQKLDADDKRTIQQAKARIRYRNRSQTRRDTYRPQDSVVRMQIDNKPGSHTLHDLNLLLVCRQAYAKTALLPYSLGSFDIRGEDKDEDDSLCYHLHALETFTNRRTKEQIGAISCLTFDGYRDDASQSQELIEETGAFWVANLAQAFNHELHLRLHASLTV